MLKKGSKVRILRKESYWFNRVGVVISVEKASIIRYPVVICVSSTIIYSFKIHYYPQI